LGRCLELIDPNQYPTWERQLKFDLKVKKNKNFFLSFNKIKKI